MTSGVYKIQCLASGRCYVGSSINIEKRMNWHRHMLGRGRHHSPALQAAHDKHGMSQLSFTMIEECSVDELSMREQYWMTCLDCLAPKGYNVCPSTEGTRGYRHKESTKKKMSESAIRVASSVEERERRRQRALEQWKNGNIGRKR